MWLVLRGNGMVMRHSLKHGLEYGAICCWGWIFRVLPYRCALAIGWIAAWIGHYVVRYRRVIVRERIKDVFPDFPPRRIRAIAWLSWRNLVFNIIDTCRLSKMDHQWLREHIVDYDATAKRMLEDGCLSHGMVAVSMHMGCPEAIARFLQNLGGNVFVVFKTQKNALVDRKLLAMRSATGITCLPVGDGLYKQVLRRLRDGSTLAILADLRVDEGGLLIDFLGRKASIGPGAALFARRAGVPLQCDIFSREGFCRHRVEIRITLKPDLSLPVEEDVQRMMQAVFSEFEQAIRQKPEQWFWYNKKWILG